MSLFYTALANRTEPVSQNGQLLFASLLSIRILVLETLQQQGWPQRIANPFPEDGSITARARLHDAIKTLNRCQRLALVRFRGDGTGHGVQWVVSEEAAQGAAERRLPKV